MGAKESAVAKSTGPQERKDMRPQDIALYRVVASKTKVSKQEAGYRNSSELAPSGKDGSSAPHHLFRKRGASCTKCKFNLGDEEKCHIVDGRIDNEQGVSKFFSPKGAGMLPGDIVWEFVKDTRNKLAYKEGHVIRNGALGFQCKDCKYYLYSRNCLLIKGRFRPEMSCGFIVKVGNGTKV